MHRGDADREAFWAAFIARLLGHLCSSCAPQVPELAVHDAGNVAQSGQLDIESDRDTRQGAQVVAAAGIDAGLYHLGWQLEALEELGRIPCMHRSSVIAFLSISMIERSAARHTCLLSARHRRLCMAVGKHAPSRTTHKQSRLAAYLLGAWLRACSLKRQPSR